MNDIRITIIGGICTVTTSEGQSISSKLDIERFDTAVTQGRLLRFDYGGVIWYEPVNDHNRHMLRVNAPKYRKERNANRIETRGRPKGGGKNIPDKLIIKMKKSGMSGRQVARELERLGYGVVSPDFPNRVLRELGIELNNQQRGGRPRRGESK